MNESYAVGAVLGQIEATQEEAARLGLDIARAGENLRHGPHFQRAKSRNGSGRVQPTVRGLPVPANAAGASYLSPRLKARMMELGLHAADLAGIAGSGAAGRVTVEDFEKFIAHLEKHKISQASSMRVAVADAMRRSWTRPIAHVGLPVCLDPLLAHRKIAQPKPGPALYALRALARGAGGKQRASAGRLVGNKIVHPSAIDIGFAVEAEDGVLVPVIRNADKQSLKELVAPYNELVELARAAQTARRAPPAARSPPSPTSARSASNGPRRFRCRSRRWCWAWARRGTMPHWDESKASSCRSWRRT